MGENGRDRAIEAVRVHFIHRMKRSELFFSAVLVPLDYLMIVLAGLSVYAIRFGAVSGFLPVVFPIPFRGYANVVVVVAGIWIVVFAIAGLYSQRSTRKFFQEVSKVVLAGSAAIMVVIILIFLRRELFSSRFIVLAGWVLGMVYVMVGRTVVRFFQRALLRRNIGAHRVVLVGKGRNAEEIQEAIRANKTLGFAIVKMLSDVNDETKRELASLAATNAFDEIIQADPAMPKEAILELIDFSNEAHVGFRYAADLYNTKVTNVEVETIAGVPVIELKKTPLDGWGRVAKRGADVVFSALGLVLLSPFFLLIAAIIRSDSRGPIFVRLERIGEGGKRFWLYKFRSMVAGAHAMKKELLVYNERQDGPLFKMTNDPRITTVGKHLRRWSIDELPQLLNVLKGEMSLVGPRPHEPEEVSQYKKHHRKVLTLKPGITGMAQVSGRSDLQFEEEVRLDSYYIENWTPWLDLFIFFKTFIVVLSRRSSV